MIDFSSPPEPDATWTLRDTAAALCVQPSSGRAAQKLYRRSVDLAALSDERLRRSKLFARVGLAKLRRVLADTVIADAFGVLAFKVDERGSQTEMPPDYWAGLSDDDMQRVIGGQRGPEVLPAVRLRAQRTWQALFAPAMVPGDALPAEPPEHRDWTTEPWWPWPVAVWYLATRDESALAAVQPGSREWRLEAEDTLSADLGQASRDLFRRCARGRTIHLLGIESDGISSLIEGPGNSFSDIPVSRLGAGAGSSVEHVGGEDVWYVAGVLRAVSGRRLPKPPRGATRGGGSERRWWRPMVNADGLRGLVGLGPLKSLSPDENRRVHLKEMENRIREGRAGNSFEKEARMLGPAVAEKYPRAKALSAKTITNDKDGEFRPAYKREKAKKQNLG